MHMVGALHSFHFFSPWQPTSSPRWFCPFPRVGLYTDPSSFWRCEFAAAVDSGWHAAGKEWKDYFNYDLPSLWSYNIHVSHAYHFLIMRLIFWIESISCDIFSRGFSTSRDQKRLRKKLTISRDVNNVRLAWLWTALHSREWIKNEMPEVKTFV